MIDRKLKVPQFIPDAETTKSRILLEAAKKFAVFGYSTVSIRDIAEATGILPGSIYNHFEGKQRILENIMQMCEGELWLYYEMQIRLAQEAESFSLMLENMFVESVDVVNPFCYCALYTASTTQFEFESSRQVYFHTYFQEGYRTTCRMLDICIARGLVEPFDTEAVSSVIMNCVQNMVSITVGRLNGFYQEFDILKWYAHTMDLIRSLTGSDRS